MNNFNNYVCDLLQLIDIYIYLHANRAGTQS